jgi:hypothetical protein
MKRTLLTLFLVMTAAFVSYGQDSFSADQSLIYAQVEQVKITKNSNGNWNFDVTLIHDDTGWDHYADLWIIINPDNGEIFGSRVLAHPHVKEQPFTRSLNNVNIPENITMIEIRAKCNLHGFLGKRIRLDLKNFE